VWRREWVVSSHKFDLVSFFLGTRKPNKGGIAITGEILQGPQENTRNWTPNPTNETRIPDKNPRYGQPLNVSGCFEKDGLYVNLIYNFSKYNYIRPNTNFQLQWPYSNNHLYVCELLSINPNPNSYIQWVLSGYLETHHKLIHCLTKYHHRKQISNVLIIKDGHIMK